MNTKINFAGIEMKNPVTVASGTFGYGREFSNFFDLSKLGGIITKGTSLKPRSGNKPSSYLFYSLICVSKCHTSCFNIWA